MANNSHNVVKRAAPVAAVYTAAELVKASDTVFGKSQDIVAAALVKAGMKSATIEAAKKVVNDFASKEVK